MLEHRCGKLKNSTYLFDRSGNAAFVYDKQHLPPAEVKLGIEPGNDNGKCRCIADVDGIRFAFMTCYDVYYNEQKYMRSAGFGGGMVRNDDFIEMGLCPHAFGD